MSTIKSKVLETAQANIKVAEEIHQDLSGAKRQGGLTLTVIGDYVVVDDEQDRWLTTVDDYRHSLDCVISSALAGRYKSDDDRSGMPVDMGDAYSDLCSTGCMYSNIGSGDYNDRLSDLLTELRESLSDAEVEKICEELQIDVAEVEAAEVE